MFRDKLGLFELRGALAGLLLGGSCALSSTSPPIRPPPTFGRMPSICSISSAPADLLSSVTAAPQTPQTLTEKIVQRYSVGLAPGERAKAGDHVTLAPHHYMTHDNSGPVALKFKSIGASEIP
jgi:homoaconitate hydratase